MTLNYRVALPEEGDCRKIIRIFTFPFPIHDLRPWYVASQGHAHLYSASGYHELVGSRKITISFSDR